MTVNLPATLRGLLQHAVDELRYEGLSEICVALIIWDIYSRQPHGRTGPIMQRKAWEIEAYAERVASRRGFSARAGLLKPHRFTVRVPHSLYPLALEREKEERYRSDSAYIVSLVLFAFDPDVPQNIGIPHPRLSGLMREPSRIREAVFEKLAADFGNPARRWPHDAGTARVAEQGADDLDRRLGQLVADQRQLALKFE